VRSYLKRDNAFVVGNDGSVKLVADRIGELYYARERNKERSTGSVFAAGLPVPRRSRCGTGD
jgi:hypothetical protein